MATILPKTEFKDGISLNSIIRKQRTRTMMSKRSHSVNRSSTKRQDETVIVTQAYPINSKYVVRLSNNVWL